MHYFVLQVRTGDEAKYLRLATPRIDADQERLFWPRRKLRIRKKRRTREVEVSLFPGYLFLETEKFRKEAFWALRKTNGFFRFLPDNKKIEPLSGPDEALIRHFLSFGEVLEKSKVTFDKNNRIRVIHGAMKGLEGSIVKVDRRKQRAKVKLALYESSFLIDFGFELLEPAESNEKTT